MKTYINMKRIDLEDHIRTSIIIFDTSALLDLYFYSDNSLDEIHKNILVKLKRKLWIPSQVHYEFLKNRDKVIKKPLTKYEDLISRTKGDGGHVLKMLDSVNAIKNKDLKELINQFKTLKEKTSRPENHPYIHEAFFAKLDISIERFSEAANTFEESIKAFKNDCDKLIDDKSKELDIKDDSDKVLSIVNDCFEIGEPISFSKLMQIVKEGSFRYENEIPPGYRDEDKIGMNVYGDLIIWKEILSYSKKKNANVLLVSNDLKDDWYDTEIEDSPRLELLIEFNSNTDNNFWMLNTSRFIRLAAPMLGGKIHEETIDNIEEIEESLQESILPKSISNDDLQEIIQSHYCDEYKDIEITNSLIPGTKFSNKPITFQAQSVSGENVLICVYIINSKRYGKVFRAFKTMDGVAGFGETNNVKQKYHVFLIVDEQENIPIVTGHLHKNFIKKSLNKNLFRLSIFGRNGDTFEKVMQNF